MLTQLSMIPKIISQRTAKLVRIGRIRIQIKLFQQVKMTSQIYTERQTLQGLYQSVQINWTTLNSNLPPILALLIRDRCLSKCRRSPKSRGTMSRWPSYKDLTILAIKATNQPSKRVSKTRPSWPQANKSFQRKRTSKLIFTRLRT